MVLGQVVVDVVAEPLVGDGLLVQRHRDAHGQPAEELRAGGRGVHDRPGGEDAGGPRHPDLPGVGVDPDLDEVRAERVHGVVVLVR